MNGLGMHKGQRGKKNEFLYQSPNVYSEISIYRTLARPIKS